MALHSLALVLYGALISLAPLALLLHPGTREFNRMGTEEMSDPINESAGLTLNNRHCRLGGAASTRKELALKVANNVANYVDP